MKILVVEDDPRIARMMRRALEQAGYSVSVAEDGATGLSLEGQDQYGVIVLDIMMPGADGWSVCEQLRARGSRVPILMVTARSLVGDRVKGLDLGADDYLPKPFDIEEFLARIRALLRRDKVHRARVIRIADLVIDTGQHSVSRAGVEIPLSRREYDLLEALAAHEGQVLTRDVILDRIWMDDDSGSHTVDVYINMLRKKVDGSQELKLIQTVRGVGYTLRVPSQEDRKPALPSDELQ